MYQKMDIGKDLLEIGLHWSGRLDPENRWVRWANPPPDGDGLKSAEPFSENTNSGTILMDTGKK